MVHPTTTNIYGRMCPPVVKYKAASKDIKLTGFKYPIESSPLRGYFSQQSGDALFKSMLRTLIRTQRGERFMLPDYGCNVKEYLFEPLDETTFGLIKREIQHSMNKYLKVINLYKLRVFNNNTVLNVQLFCKIRGENNVNLDVNIEI